MFTRIIAACALVFSLVACQEVKGSPDLITASGPIKILQTTYVSTGDSSNTLSGGSLTYVIVKLEYTNTYKDTLIPIVEHFILTDSSGNRYSAVDSGSSALAGISNDTTALKSGDKRIFTIGFRTQATTTGVIGYDY
jgi:hypothetical protein